MNTWDFFVSFQQADRDWGEWVAWELEAAGHSVLFQLWDFVPGRNWVDLMQDGVSRSARLIVLLSPAYTNSVFAAAEWQAVWANDPNGAQRRVIPVRVVDCARPALLGGVVGIDLFGVPEPKARERLQNAIERAHVGRAKPLMPPSFPGSSARDATTAPGRPTDTASTPFQAPARRPWFVGRSRLNLRGARGVQIGDHNEQTHYW